MTREIAMRAAYYERNGSAREVLRVGEVETPHAGPGEVRVKLATSGVNPSDVKARQGSRKIAWPRLIPQSDGAGVIDEVGDGVPQSRLGERVWIWNGQWKRPFGTAAEYIALPAAQAVKLPDNISFEVGACLGIPALTAYHAVVLAETKKGDTVLVTGGAGAVGQYVIQFAKAAGATVIATISSPEKAALAREVGADHTIDYKREDVSARVMEITGGKPVDSIIEMDIASNAKYISAVLKPKGSVIVYGTSNPQATIPAGFGIPNATRYQFFIVYELNADERERAISAIASALERGALKHRIANPTYALDDIAAAHEAVERGSIGNVVVTM
jgi:NADPH:quinone reductase